MHETKIDQNRNDEKTNLEKTVKIEEEKKESSTSAPPTAATEEKGIDTTADTTTDKKEEDKVSSNSPLVEDSSAGEDGEKATAMDVVEDAEEEKSNSSTGENASSDVIKNSDETKKDDDGDVVMGDSETDKPVEEEKAEEKETNDSKESVKDDAEGNTAAPEEKIETKEKEGDSDVKEEKETEESKNQEVSSSDSIVEKSDEPAEKESTKSDEARPGSNGTSNSTSAPEPVESDKTEAKMDAISSEKASTDEKIDRTEKKDDDEKKNENAPPATAAAPPPPVMKGTLSIDQTPTRRHLIRGMWNYENSNMFPPQRFELVRNLGPDEDAEKLPVDGEFHGSFSLAYVHTTSKGKRKERSKVIPETGVNIKFTKVDGGSSENEYKVNGKGTNQFGIFHINGTATPSSHPGDDKTFNIVLRKRYEPGPAVATPAAEPTTAVVKTKAGGSTTSLPLTEDPAGPLPDPAKSFSTGVVALRGNIIMEESNDLGVTEVVHRIKGMWAAGLDFVLGDPENKRGLCNRFEYEHKSSVPSQQFPVSGRYSGWFDLSNEDGSRTRINERDITLKFRKNNAGYHNIEGKGSNVFGKYTITGTLTADKVITIFRHFQPRKLKKTAGAPASAAPGSAVSGTAPTRRPSVPAFEPKLKLDDVKIPNSEGKSPGQYEPIKIPEHGTYSAVSRGVLRLNDDGSHSCQGKWAVTRDHFTNGQTSNFNFRLEGHFAAEALEAQKKEHTGKGEARKFPLDSAMYKGSFQLRKQGSRYQTIVDQQIVMKFRKNTQGAYNVHGTGINAIGEFNLLGTLIMSGKTGGQVELFRMYPPEKLAVPAAPKSLPASSTTGTTSKPDTAGSSGGAAKSSKGAAAVPSGAAQRRESSRNIKLPSRLEEDDPSAQLTRTLDKCSQILKFMREKDIQAGAFFGEPVDPVALGIPTYYQIIKEPMDLRTIQRKMDAGAVRTPEEFARLVRLVFENAMTFNIDPAHSVHQAARNLLVMFNQKYRDVERMVQSIRRTHGIDADFDASKGKGGKKRKRQEEVKSQKRIRLEEAQAMTTANASAIAAIIAAAPANSTTVSRSEFNMMLHMIQQLQTQIVQTHRAVAELSPGDPTDAKPGSTAASGSSKSTQSAPKTTAPASAPEKKKPTQRKSEPKAHEEMVVTDDSAPLSLEEQELLTETINDLPQEHLGGVIQIIREAAPVGADEDEIDLEIDQLEVKTQRKLLRHIMKYVKKSRPKGKKKGGKAAQKKNTDKAPPTKKHKPAPKQPKQAAAATTNSFFAFGGQDGSDSDSDEDDKHQSAGPAGGKQFSQDAANEFKLSETLGLNDDDDDDIGADSIAANWNISHPGTEAEKKSDDKDDDWGAAAREQAAAAKARDADRRAREEKAKAEAEQAKSQRFAEAAERAEELKAERAEKEAKEAKEKEQKEKEDEEAVQKKKDKAREELQKVKVTVDLGDEQRDIMKEYDSSYHDLGGASPSSDFGF